MFILSLTLLLSITVVHEFGHIFFGHLTSCEHSEAILFSNQIMPYSKIWCNEPNVLVYLGGFIFSFIFSALFLLLKDHRELFHIALGISILSSIWDITAFSGIKWVQYLLFVSGIFFMVLGEYKMAFSHIDPYSPPFYSSYSISIPPLFYEED